MFPNLFAPRYIFYIRKITSYTTTQMGVWEHVKFGTFHTLFPELHLLTNSLYFICTCEQVFILALHLCVQVIQMLKYICQICWSCTPLVTSAQLSVIILLICQKHNKVPPAAHTHGLNLCHGTATGPPCGAITLYVALPFPHTVMRAYDFFTGLVFTSLSCAHHLPLQQL